MKCFALSRSMSWCDRMGSLSSLLTTMPGPSVAGPPENTMIRAPVLGNVVCHKLRLMSRSRWCRTYLQQTDGNADGDTGATQRALVIRDGPRVASKGLENASELELTLLGRHEEAGSTERLCGDWLARSGCGTVLRT